MSRLVTVDAVTTSPATADQLIAEPFRVTDLERIVRHQEGQIASSTLARVLAGKEG